MIPSSLESTKKKLQNKGVRGKELASRSVCKVYNRLVRRTILDGMQERIGIASRKG